MSVTRTMIRSQKRDLEAVHIALLAETEPNTKNTRMALAGNTGSGIRRRAARAIARAGQLFKPEQLVKVIQHKDGRAQTITTFTKFEKPEVHTIALYIAQKLKNDRIVLDEAQTVGAKS